jgi:hypothetical protein
LVANDEGQGTANRHRVMSWRHHQDHGERRAGKVLGESIRRPDQVAGITCLADRAMLDAPC